jgi:hypothetical protein
MGEGGFPFPDGHLVYALLFLGHAALPSKVGKA